MSYKKSLQQQDAPQHDQSKFRSQARQLQEFFPSWSNEDLQSLLVETNGDVELAAARISDGQAEQWDSVSRKKDKKPTGHVSKDSVSKGDFRGGRGGGRGGRGGSTRGGGAVRARGGPPRGGHLNGHSRASQTSSPAPTQPVPANDNEGTASEPGKPDASEVSKPAAADAARSQDSTTSMGWGEPSSDAPATNISSTPAWGSSNGSAVPPSVAAPIPTKHFPMKTPATSKLSWAQIAKPQEKPTPPPPPASAPISNPPSVTAPPPQKPPTPTPVPDPVPASEPQETGWEDPTTVEAPTWDDEVVPQPVVDTAQTNAPEISPEPEPALPEPEQPKPSEPEPAPAIVAPPTPTPSTPSKVHARPASVAHRNSARYSKIAGEQGGVVMPISFGSVEKVGISFGSLSLGGDHQTAPEIDSPSAKPVSPPTTLSDLEPPPVAAPPSTSASLGSGLFHTSSTQPIPSSISSPSVPTTQTPATSSASPIQSFTQQTSAASQTVPPQQSQSQQNSQSLPSHSYAQHGLPTHLDPSPQPQPLQQTQQSQSTQTPSHIQSSHQTSQQQQTQQQSQPQSTSNYFRQSDASPYFHTPTPPAGAQDNNGGPYGSFTPSQFSASSGLSGLSTGGGLGQLGGVSSMGSGVGQLGGQQQQQQQQQAGIFGDYGYDGQRNFYDTYGSSFGGSGRSALGDDLKGLTGAGQQPPPTAASTASTTTASASTASSVSNGLPPSSQTSQASSQHSPAPGQPQLSGQQGPNPGASGYPQPVPFYYQPYPQNHQYPYGAPYNSGYGGMGGMSNMGMGAGNMGGMSGAMSGMGVPQPYPGMKYPAMYPGPPGHGNAPSPAGKQAGGPGSAGMLAHGGSVIGHSGLGGVGGGGMQPQTYGGGLYGQTGAGYDEYGHHSPHQQAHQQTHQQPHQISHGLSLGQDYGKQLYGASSGQSGLPGFMGLSGQGGGGGGANSVVSGSTTGGPRSTASPEAAYKPYSQKDVGVSSARGQQGGQGQTQTQSQMQGQGVPQGQSYYGGSRFGSGGGSTPQQANAHHQQVYQGQNDGNYYYGQRGQQQYWQ